MCYNGTVKKGQLQEGCSFYFLGGIKMTKANVIEVTPDKNGNIFIKLYGTIYQIVVKDPKPNKAKDKE